MTSCSILSDLKYEEMAKCFRSNEKRATSLSNSFKNDSFHKCNGVVTRGGGGAVAQRV